MHAKFLFALILLNSMACVAKRPSRHSTAQKAELSDLSGVFVGKMEGHMTELRLDDLVPEQVRAQLLASPDDLARTEPALSVSIAREIESAEIALSTIKYYFLGINKGPIDQVMIDLDDEHSAFERTTTTFEDGRLEHQREIMYVKKNGRLEESKNAGFDITLSFSLTGQVLTLKQKVNKLGRPWTDHYTPDNKVSNVEAKFRKVEDFRKKAEIIRRSHDTDLL